MPIFFALIEERPAFYDSAVHGDRIPSAAIAITPARHAALLDAQAEGKEIYADKDGRPHYRQRSIDPDRMRADLIEAVRREAGRRIHAVSPDWRQLNDLRRPSPEGEARFTAIDAIRHASEQIEESIALATLSELSNFDACTRAEWPSNPIEKAS